MTPNTFCQYFHEFVSLCPDFLRSVHSEKYMTYGSANKTLDD
eukprot:UN01192